MKFILQIHTGSWHAAHGRPEEIIRRTGEIAARIPADKVIIGWNTDAAVYRELGAFLHRAGTEMLLWLPVFSGTGEIAETDPAADIFGQSVIPPAEQAAEGFVFGCPSSRRNIRAAEEIYEQYFADCGFDGVFLDRIRGQSFLAGVSGVLSCGCAGCRKAFLGKGVDTGAVRDLYERKRDSFFDMASFPADGRFVLKDALAQRFFDAREEIIADAVSELCGYFRGKGLAVGLDLFAPLVSRFAGQNYPLISADADFVKPMLYRRTEAPAGIGYEYELFEQHAPGARGGRRPRMDRAFLDTQLEAAGKIPCGVYPGIEINYSEGIVRTDAEYITESLAAVRDHGFEGAVLCWDVLRAPEAHIEAVTGFEGKAADPG